VPKKMQQFICRFIPIAERRVPIGVVRLGKYTAASTLSRKNHPATCRALFERFNAERLNVPTLGKDPQILDPELEDFPAIPGIPLGNKRNVYPR